MAIVALVLWTFTVGAGVYLLVTSTRPRSEHQPPAAVAATEPATAAAAVPAAASAASAASAPPSPAAQPAADGMPKPDKNRFDPPSLTRAKSQPIPGGRALAEFVHPLLGITGFGIFLGYMLTRDWFLGAIALGVGLGTVAAGLSWAAVNARAARRAANGGAHDPHAMTFTPRALLLHGAGAALTILLAALIAARV